MSVIERGGVLIERTHLNGIHPTKGYRSASVPRGTNKRRRPILASFFSGSTEANKRAKTWKRGG